MALPAALPADGAVPLVTGIGLGITPSAPGWVIELQRAPESGGAPDTGNAVTIATLPPGTARGITYIDHLPRDNANRYYRFRLTNDGYDPGAWSDFAGPAKPTVIEGKLTTSLLEGRASVYPILRAIEMQDGNYATQAIDQIGTVMPADVVQNDGVATRVIAKGKQVGTARHGDAVTFATAYPAPPLVILRGGISYEPRSGQWDPSYDSTKPQYDVLKPLNPTASGFTLQAQLRQKGAQTPDANSFADSNLADAEGETVECDLANLAELGAAGNLYDVHWSIRIRVTCPNPGKPPASVTVKVGVETNDGGGWVERYEATYVVTAIYGECGGGGGAYEEYLDSDAAFVLNVSGMSTNDDVRLKLKSITNPGNLYDAVQLHGLDGVGEGTGVRWNEATDAYASKTPDTEDLVDWEAMLA